MRGAVRRRVALSHVVVAEGSGASACLASARLGPPRASRARPCVNAIALPVLLCFVRCGDALVCFPCASVWREAVWIRSDLASDRVALAALVVLLLAITARPTESIISRLACTRHGVNNQPRCGRRLTRRVPSAALGRLIHVRVSLRGGGRRGSPALPFGSRAALLLPNKTSLPPPWRVEPRRTCVVEAWQGRGGGGCDQDFRS